MEYRIGYGSFAGSADIFVDINDSDINALYEESGCFPIEDSLVQTTLPELHKSILAQCQKQEDDCIRAGLYNTEEFSDYSPEDFLVNQYYIFN